MKRMVIAALAFGLGSAGVFAHDDGQSSGHGAELGKPGDSTKVSRTIEVKMGDDMRFKPANITVKRGETIKFVVKNDGALKHEMVLGTMKELREHAALMRKNPEMEHDDPNAVSVEPGKTGTLIWRFTKAGRFDFACLVPGHFEAGMVGKVIVSSRAAEAPSAIRQAGVAFAETGKDTTTSAGGGKSTTTAGVVKKVDKSAGKVTIKHGPMEHLGMPKNMTMVFRVKEPAMLDKLKPGDKINFVADKVGGAFTVMSFEPAK